MGVGNSVNGQRFGPKKVGLGVPRAAAHDCPGRWRLLVSGSLRSSHRIKHALLVALFGLVFLTCRDDSSGPQRPIDARFSLNPSFASSMSGLVDIDSVRAEVRRVFDDTLVLDTVAQVVGDTVDLSLTVPVFSDDDRFNLRMSLISPTGEVVFVGFIENVSPVTSSNPSGSDSSGVVDLPLDYTGTGADATGVHITTLNPVVFFGDTTALAAVALDNAGEPIANTPIGWKSLDAARADVPDPRFPLVVGGSQRGDARIVAELLTGQTDTVLVAVQPVPSAMNVIAGDDQVGVAGSALQAPIVVEVRAADGIIVRNATVVFTTTAGTVSPDTVKTDSLGIVSTDWTLGTVAGPQTLTATAIEAAGVNVTVTAGADPGPPAILTVDAGQGQSVQVNTNAPIAPSVLLTDSLGNPVSGVMIDFSVSAGGGSVTGTPATTDSSGTASVGTWVMGTVAGTNTLIAELITSTPLSPPGQVDRNPSELLDSDDEILDELEKDREARIDRHFQEPDVVTEPETSIMMVDTLTVTFTAQATPGPVNSVLITTEPTDVPAGSAISPAVQVGLYDQFNNFADNDSTSQVQIVIVPGTGAQGATLSGTIPQTVAGGTATFPDLSIDLLGTGYQLEAMVGALPSDTSVAFDVVLGVVASVVMLDSDSSNGFPLADTATAVAINETGIIPVVAFDAGGNQLTGRTFTWNVLDSTSVVIDSVGVIIVDVAHVRAVANGVDTIIVSTGGVADSLIVTVNAGAGGGGPQNIVANSATSQSATVGRLVVTPPSVLVTDVLGQPLGGQTVTFSVVNGNGQLSGATMVTDLMGVAILGGWTIDTIAGLNTISATVDTLPPVLFNATGIADTAVSMIVVSGNNQLADAGMPLPTQVVVGVRDQYGNGVGGVTINWATAFGSLSGSTSVTTSAGNASTNWTLGVSAITQTLTASATGLTPVIATATANFPNPSILLSMPSDRIAVGGTDTLTVTLTAPSAVDSLPVQVTSGNTNVITVAMPDTVFVDSGMTTGTIVLNAIAAGTATITGAAPGFTSGMLNVDGSTQVMSLPGTVNVPFGGTASLPIQLSAPAPVGGVTVTVLSGNPTAVSVQTAMTTIPQGSSLGSVILNGAAPGVATITAQSASFGNAQSVATTTANFNITTTGVTINELFGPDVTIQLESGGQPIPAPVGGVQVLFVSSDSTCAVMDSVVIGAGFVSATANPRYGGSAITTCNAVLTATGPSINSDVVTVTVNAAPAISLSGTTVATGLQQSCGNCVNLGFNNRDHGGVTITVKSLDPSLLLISPDASTPGTDSIQVFLADQQYFFTYYVQGVEAAADTGIATAAVMATASPTLFQSAQANVSVRQLGVEIIGLSTGGLTTLSADDPFYVRVGYPSGSGVASQSIRAGGQVLTATIRSSQPTVGQLTTTSATDSIATVTIPVGVANSPTTVATGGVAFDPLLADTTTIAASIPGVIMTPNADRVVTTTAPTITASGTTVGTGLQQNCNGCVNLGIQNRAHGGVTVTVRSLDPGALLLSPNNLTAGTDSIQVFLPDQQYFFSYTANGVEFAADTGNVAAGVVVTTSPAIFQPDTGTTSVRQAAIDLVSLSTTGLTTLSPDDPFYVRVGYPSGNGVASQPIRVGGQALTATIRSSQPAVGQLVTNTTTDSVVTVTIGVGASNSPTTVAPGGVAFDPLTADTTTIAASVPNLISTPNSDWVVTTTAPALTASGTTVGTGLQQVCSNCVNLLVQNRAHGGVTVTVRSADPTALLISPNDSTPGTDSIQVFLPDSSYFFSYWAQGVEAAADTGIVSAQVIVTTSPALFVPDTATVSVRQPGVQLIGLQTSGLTTLSADDPFYARVGYPSGSGVVTQAIRAGGQAATVTFTSSRPSVGQLVTNAITAGSVTATIPVRASNSPTTVAPGGVAFDALTADTTTVAATIPGFISTPSSDFVVTTTAPAISMGTQTVGAGLQQQCSNCVNLNIQNRGHGGVTLTLRSSNPGVLLVSPDANTAGSDSIQIFVPDQQYLVSYYVQGTALGQTGSVTVDAIADVGFSNGSAVMTVVQPALDVIGVQTNNVTTLSLDDPFYVRVGRPSGNGVFAQAVRMGGPTLTTTVVTSQPSVGILVTNADTAASIMMDIAPGLFQTPTTVAPGGVALDPLTAGMTTVSATIPGHAPTPNSDWDVAISSPAITLSGMTVGGGLQGSCNSCVDLGASSRFHGGVTVTLTSSDSSLLLLAPDAATPGTGTLQINLADGSYRATYYAQALNLGSNTGVTVTATVTGFVSDSATVTISPAALILSGLNTFTTVGGANDLFLVTLGYQSGNSVAIQSIRVGGPALTATITSSAASIGQLVTSAVPGAGSVTVTIPATASSSPSTVLGGGVEFDPLAQGATTVSATIPGVVQTPNGVMVVNVNP